MATEDRTVIHNATSADHPKPKEVHFLNPPLRRPTVATAPQRRRLGVDDQGQYTYKKTPSSTLVGALQLGLQHSIGSIEPKPRRDILMTDFEVVETADFPANGSDSTPAHKYKDFTFKTYSPEAFRYFREAFGIVAEDYLLAMCDQSLREVSNPGASGSLFYLSADDAFIIKTVQKKEARFLQKLLPGYYLNLTQNKRTLLPKFFGLYRYKSGSVNIRIVVMNNLLPTSIRYHEKYDLKGSTYKRKAGTHELTKKSPTFKDLDFMDKHGEGVLLAPDKYEALLKTVDRDCKVLQSFGIMDYSLLVGIHNMDLMMREKTGASVASNPDDDSDVVIGMPLRSRIELSKNFSIVSTENIPLLAQTEAAKPETYPEGYIQGRLQEDRVLIYMGIIDILQSYRLKKKLEHTMKSVFADGNTVSVHNPTFYARRFQEFMTQQVFKRDKAKGRSRKSTAAAQGKGHRQGGASRRGGGTRQDPRLSPLHESTSAAVQQKAGGTGIRPITRGRSASEYIPRSKGKDHLPEIPAMSMKPSEEVQALSVSAKVSSVTTPTSLSASVPTSSTAATEHQFPSRAKVYVTVTDESAPRGNGTDEVLEASTDFARNVRGTSTPIDISPEMSNNRSQTFNGEIDLVHTLDRKSPIDGTSEAVDLADSLDTQQIELSLVDDHEEVAGLR